MATFNVEFHSGEQEAFEAFDLIPNGDFVGVVRQAQMKGIGGLAPSDAGYKGCYVNLGHTITEGEYAGRWVFSKIHLGNPSADTVMKARQRFEGLTQALGVTINGNVEDALESLLEIPCVLKVRQEGHKSEYGASNTVTGYGALPSDDVSGEDLT